MRKRGNLLSFDSRDLMRSQCSHCVRLAAAREQGVPGVKELVDQFYVAPNNLAIRYGIRYETELEQELLFNLGDKIQAPATNSPETTIELMASGVPVIYQGSLYGGSGDLPFSGRPDFLVRGDYQLHFGSEGLTAVQGIGNREGYSAWDAKLSANPKPEYQNQVGLYADVLQTLGLESHSDSGLILGSRELIGFSSEVLITQMAIARGSLTHQINQFLEEDVQRLEDVGSLICDASSYCDICEYPALCEDQRREQNHLQLVAGITRNQIESLNRAGVKTVAQLASFSGETDKLSTEATQKLATQARLQQHTYDTGENIIEVISRAELEKLPKLNPGDIFFDLEGFTFFEEAGGLEYLFGYTSVESGEEFHFEWADDRESEKVSFERFMAEALHRQKLYPGCKIYHYANYEQAALKRLAERFGSYRAEVEHLIANAVFIDLYKVVKAAMLISQESYSIKKLERYYSFGRSSDVKEAMGSMEYYDQYLELLTDDYEEAVKLKRQVIAYNQDDCASTLALYSWLKSL
jgi:predicted RecB family nuclease